MWCRAIRAIWFSFIYLIAIGALMQNSQSQTPVSSLRAHWPVLAASMLSQACPSAASLLHSCAMLLTVKSARNNVRQTPLKQAHYSHSQQTERTGAT
jgi:ribulose-5-phosphate 4-epimerase/fuculose-1-phosphate aldolase